MLNTMLIMALGFWAYTIAVALSRVRSIILEREKDSQWVRELRELRQ
jgi:heme exporter protein C